jgi:anhydro-N-acetylmuramic acid kinase
MASQGKVDSNCVESLASFDWFGIAPPKFTIAETFTELLRHESLQALSPQDKVATLTALTARIIYDFCKKEFITQSNDLSIYISGGGANNQTLLEYLTTYFDPLPVKTVEEIGVPVDLYIPLAFGLTVDACVTGNAQPGKAQAPR